MASEKRWTKQRTIREADGWFSETILGFLLQPKQQMPIDIFVFFPPFFLYITHDAIWWDSDAQGDTMHNGTWEQHWIIQCANVQSRTIPYNQILLSLQGFVFLQDRSRSAETLAPAGRSGGYKARVPKHTLARATTGLQQGDNLKAGTPEHLAEESRHPQWSEYC
jgi:hypothetical protein